MRNHWLQVRNSLRHEHLSWSKNGSVRLSRCLPALTLTLALSLGVSGALTGCSGTKETDSTQVSGAPTAGDSGNGSQTGAPPGGSGKPGDAVIGQQPSGRPEGSGQVQPPPVSPDGEDEAETGKPQDPLPETIPAFPGEGQEEEGASGGPGVDEEEAYQWENRAIIATDIHYLSRELTDGGSGFQYMVEHGDGKVVTYIEPITDAFLEEVIRERPDVLILSGDLTLDGEKKSHEELSGKLYQVEEAGIPVVVIPGNHDINNHHAAQYKGEDRFPAEFTTPEEFREIYRDFGYDEAVSRDRTSLSYVYELDADNRLLMLDTCQYKKKALVGGAILSDTYDWIQAQLEDAWDCGMNVIPVAHHNLLDESEIYVDDCTIEHGEQLVQMLEEWDVPLFLSGHLHVQHTKRSGGNKGVWEMVTSSLATPACQYGRLDFWDDGSFVYETCTVDVEGWARRQGRKEIELLEFEAFKEPFLRRVFYNQSNDVLEKNPDITGPERERMSRLYSELNYHYYQGTAYLIKEETLKNPDYKLWMNDGFFTVLSDYVQYIVEDAEGDYNKVEMRE